MKQVLFVDDSPQLTNLDVCRYRQQYLRLGANHFLSKIMEFDKITETILA